MPGAMRDALLDALRSAMHVRNVTDGLTKTPQDQGEIHHLSNAREECGAPRQECQLRIAGVAMRRAE